MEIRRLIIILICLFGVMLTILAMGNPGVTLESADWTTVGRNVSYFIIYLAVLAIVMYFMKEWVGRR